MQIDLWPIERVTPYDRNPRLNDQAVDAVAASLKEFGFRQPIVVDKDGVIVVGHTRWKAAKKLGLAQVPVHIATDLSPEQAKAYRLADNQTATIAEWDKELLPLELADLQSMGVDLGLLGFSEDELAKWLQPVQDGLCDPDDVPAPPDEATTQPSLPHAQVQRRRTPLRRTNTNEPHTRATGEQTSGNAIDKRAARSRTTRLLVAEPVGGTCFSPMLRAATGRDAARAPPQNWGRGS
jgi:ParB-like chromosome segregation protein Spo0J